MKKLFIISILSSIFFLSAFAQSNAKAKKAVSEFQKGDYDKGISDMRKVIDTDPSGENWDILVQMYSQRYTYADNVYKQNLAAELGKLLGIKQEIIKYESPDKCFADLISACNEAALYTRSATQSMLMRIYFVDYQPDSVVSDSAKKEFKTAEKYFGAKDFVNAKKYYQRALAIEPNYYMAMIYLGDSHWYLKNMDSALICFQNGIDKNPTLLEPRKYKVDALAYIKKNEEAKVECINTFCIYPDYSMFMKYSDLISREGKKFDIHFAKRGCTINQKDKEIVKTNDPNWSIYQSAMNEVSGKCDNKGILTNCTSKYLEVYSWEKMLKESKQLPAELAFAKKMADAGYLDCYVFISAFHHDYYEQYIDFVANNKDRIKTYVEKYLVQ